MMPISMYQLMRRCFSNSNSEEVIRARKKMIILLRDNIECTHCGSKIDLTIEHLEHDEKKDGNHVLESYQPDKCKTLCIICHSEKHGITASDMPLAFTEIKEGES